MPARVVAVCAETRHGFSKRVVEQIELIEGHGVRSDAHGGATVQHIFDRRRDASKPNLRQVHLLEAELFDELEQVGFNIAPGDLGENIVISGLALDALPRGALLHVGNNAILCVTGLREPCVKIDRFRPGLRAAVTERREGVGRVVRRAVMGVVTRGGVVMSGDCICIATPSEPHEALALV
jgi:MOSC domain-containing protein YiiM